MPTPHKLQNMVSYAHATKALPWASPYTEVNLSILLVLELKSTFLFEHTLQTEKGILPSQIKSLDQVNKIDEYGYDTHCIIEGWELQLCSRHSTQMGDENGTRYVGDETSNEWRDQGWFLLYHRI